MYDDFPILSDEEYLQINAQYAKNNYDFSLNLQQTIQHLNASKQYSFNPLEKLSKPLADTISNARETIDVVLSNINLIFNAEIISNSQVKEFNIFSFLNELITSVQCLQQINANEQKIYYKTFANKSIQQLLSDISKIVENLSASNIKIYKYI